MRLIWLSVLVLVEFLCVRFLLCLLWKGFLNRSCVVVFLCGFWKLVSLIRFIRYGICLILVFLKLGVYYLRIVLVCLSGLMIRFVLRFMILIVLLNLMIVFIFFLLSIVIMMFWLVLFVSLCSV